MGKTFRNCTHCVHGKKPLDSRTCKPCILKDKNNFKDRGKAWPVRQVPHLGEVGPLTRIHLLKEPIHEVMADLKKRAA